MGGMDEALKEATAEYFIQNFAIFCPGRPGALLNIFCRCGRHFLPRPFGPLFLLWAGIFPSQAQEFLPTYPH